MLHGEYWMLNILDSLSREEDFYVLAGGKHFHPENILFEQDTNHLDNQPEYPLCGIKEGVEFEIFRQYSDCLYSAYGTKWNGNAAAYNVHYLLFKMEEFVGYLH